MLKIKGFIKKYWPEFIFIPLIFIADRISKTVALKYLRPLESVEILPFFRLTYVENTGAAFGSFHNNNMALAAAAGIILFFLFKWRGEFLLMGKWAGCAVIFIAAGALGNLYDRITLGYVVDYFDFIVWPVFNVADSFISVGAVWLLILSFTKTINKRALK